MSCELGKEHVCCTRIENLSVNHGKETILKDINLHLHCGELTAIIGPNGAGKSTFIKALLNVIPHQGKIEFESERCAADCRKERSLDHAKYCECTTTKTVTTTKPKFGYVPQSLSIGNDSPVSVEDFVRSSVSNWPVWLPPRKKDRELVQEVLRATNTQNLVNRKLSELSGGEFQRVMLALAIHPLPDILLLDEPVSGVDQKGMKTFYEMVSSLRRDYDITILLVSHDLNLIARHADRVVFINQAQAKVGTVEEIYSSSDFIKCFGKISLDAQDNYDQSETSEEEEQ